MADLITVRRDHLETMLAYLASGPWTPSDKPEVSEAWKGLTEAKDASQDAESAADPGLPPGEFATVHVMGHDQVTGWVSDGTRAGVPVMVVRDWDGQVLREIPGHALYQFVPLPTPLRRPEPLPFPDATMALPVAEAYEDGDPWQPATDAEADAFAGRTDPDMPF
jgi:hypothetical protein